MAGAAQTWLQPRRGAAYAIALPGLAGIAYLVLSGAPWSFAVINFAALVTAILCASFLKLPERASARRMLALGLLAVLLTPLITGPSVDGVSRWLSVSGFSLHAGFLVIPLLCVLAALDRGAAPFILFSALIVTFFQPDAASCLALAFACLGLVWVNRDWRVGAIAALAFFASLGASFPGALPPQPFVEGIVTELWHSSPLAAIGLAASLVVSLFIIATTLPIRKAPRLSLAGAFAGFSFAAFLGDYPYPLIGYGAASILGMGLALMHRGD